jgi:hypothetical protein
MVDFLLNQAGAGSGAFSPEAITERQAPSQSDMVTLRLFAAIHAEAVKAAKALRLSRAQFASAL